MSKSTKKMRQFKLRHGNTHTTCYLEDDPRLKVGNRVTLKTSDDPKKLWEIESRSEVTTELGSINQAWKVGGI
jgi:hypothetical protein